MRLKSTNIPQELENSNFCLEQHLPHRDLWDSEKGRVAIYDKSKIHKDELRWFRGPLENLVRWLEIADIKSKGQTYAETKIILALQCV